MAAISRTIILDPGRRTVQIGGNMAVLDDVPFKLLHILAGQREPVHVTKLAADLGIRSTVDVVSVARAKVMVIRAKCRSAGLGDVVTLLPRVGYSLEAGLEAVILPEAPREHAGRRRDPPRGPNPTTSKRVRQPLQVPSDRLLTLPSDLRSLLGAVPDRADGQLDPAQALAVTRFGIVDFADRSLVFPSGRLNVNMPRDFAFLAAVMVRGGAVVEEPSLLRLCGHDRARYGSLVLRRAAKRVNAVLAERGLPFRVEPTDRAYGSEYRGVAVRTG